MASPSPKKSPGKAKTTAKKPTAPKLHPSYLEMTVEAIKATTDTKGASVPSIRNYITEKYKSVNPTTVRFQLKQALTKALEKELIVKSKQSDERPLMASRFRVNRAKKVTEKKKKTENKETKKKTAKPKDAEKTKATTKKTTPSKSPKKSKPKKEVKKSPKRKAKAAPKTPTKIAKPKTTKQPQSAKKTKKAK